LIGAGRPDQAQPAEVVGHDRSRSTPIRSSSLTVARAAWRMPVSVAVRGDRPSFDLPGLVAQAQDQAGRAAGTGRSGRAGPAASGAAERPAAAQRPVRQPAGSAHQDVTRGSVSGSVDAPVQRQALALVNEHRRRDGCPDLTLGRRLIAAANRHAADMTRRGYFAHS
jgi:uncharacterized protein YkwD